MKTALVTGAKQGIGATTAVALAKASYSVAINYRSDDKIALKSLQPNYGVLTHVSSMKRERKLILKI